MAKKFVQTKAPTVDDPSVDGVLVNSGDDAPSEATKMTKTKTLGPLDEHGMHTVIESESPASAAATAASKPGDLDYDWSPHYPDAAELYRHTYPDGQVVSIRRFGDIYSKQWLRSIRDLATEFDIESAAIDRASCDVARALIDNRPCPIGGPDDFQELWKAWSAAGSGDGEDSEGLTAGE